eukprot:TRINITY_DN13703_c0_g1_i1.p1 TRINITY_DN13703_c0_g1~~TRINITY_DN13703_c0_g1_i1.p1  ORF type:complete len:354 (-),score=63.95 TRINITY_DN13703_c0_g1_i1:159-1220(-)
MNRVSSLPLQAAAANDVAQFARASVFDVNPATGKHVLPVPQPGVRLTAIGPVHERVCFTWLPSVPKISVAPATADMYSLPAMAPNSGYPQALPLQPSAMYPPQQTVPLYALQVPSGHPGPELIRPAQPYVTSYPSSAMSSQTNTPPMTAPLPSPSVQPVKSVPVPMQPAVPPMPPASAVPIPATAPVVSAPAAASSAVVVAEFVEGPEKQIFKDAAVPIRLVLRAPNATLSALPNNINVSLTLESLDGRKLDRIVRGCMAGQPILSAAQFEIERATATDEVLELSVPDVRIREVSNHHGGLPLMLVARFPQLDGVEPAKSKLFHVRSAQLNTPSYMKQRAAKRAGLSNSRYRD